MTDFNLKTIQLLDHKSKKIVANFADSEVKKETITMWYPKSVYFEWSQTPR